MLFIAYCGNNKTSPLFEISLLSKNVKDKGLTVVLAQ